jgi:predicted DNA-binding protein with PD1-like motif
MTMHALPLRIPAGADLREVLAALPARYSVDAAFVLQGIGSLSVACIRFAGAPDMTELRGDLEILTLGGSLSPDGPHLHMSVSDAAGRVIGGHMGPGCVVRTTAEVLVALLPGHRFSREHDPATGYKELFVKEQR